MFNKDHCSPKRNKKIKSCISKDTLKTLAETINTFDECDKINVKLKPNKLKGKIKNELSKISECKYESCWPKINKLMEQLDEDTKEDLELSFKPTKPQTWYSEPNKWLNTSDIDNVLDRYEEKYEKFKYYGAIPIDFDRENSNGTCAVNEICKINLKEVLDDGFNSIGVVFNTDTSLGPGQHWFSIYVDLVGKNIKNTPCFYYFDSVGADAPDEVEELVNDLVEQSKTCCKKPLKVAYNNLQHQYKNTECGVYSIHFLTEMVKGNNFKKYIQKRIPDEEIEKFRNIFFIENK